MIVRDDGDVVRLITQSEHAGLAGRAMDAWTAGGFVNAPRRRAILLAAAEHDNGWREPDRAPLVEPLSGRILDFMTAPVAIRQAVWPRAVSRLAHEPWAAALVAEHALHLYARFRRATSWAGFFAGLEASRDELLAAAGLTRGDLEADYAFVRLGDLVSLAFCTGWRDTHRHGGVTVAFDGADVRVTPDPFSGAQVPLAVTARELPNRPYDGAADAAAVFRAARTVELRGVARGGQI
jgi:hypothetical protein